MIYLIGYCSIAILFFMVSNIQVRRWRTFNKFIANTNYDVTRGYDFYNVYEFSRYFFLFWPILLVMICAVEISDVLPPVKPRS